MTDRLYIFYWSNYDEAYVLYQARLPDLDSAVALARRMKFDGFLEIWIVEPDGLYEVAVVTRDTYPMSETGYRDHGDVMQGEHDTEYIIYRQPVRVGEWVKVVWIDDESED